MPRKRPENPALQINNLITRFRSRPEQSLTPDGLPATSWQCLCLVAWERLMRSNPRWADLIEEEYENFKQTKISSGYRQNRQYVGDKAILLRLGGNVGDAWLVEAFTTMLETSLKKGQKPLDKPRHLLRYYNQFLRGITNIRKDTPGLKRRPLYAQEAFWREHLQGLLNQHPYHDETRTHAQVSPEMIEAARLGSPSGVALIMLEHLYGVSPARLRKIIFPKLRRTPLSPLELWHGMFEDDCK
ncbi:MAG: hypothetical protein ABIU05_05560 [Nitrospirales bacterium]